MSPLSHKIDFAIVFGVRNAKLRQPPPNAPQASVSVCLNLGHEPGIHRSFEPR
jgi:hypothetical protein